MANIEYKIGMKFRVEHMCSDNNVEIIKIDDMGMITLREISDAHNSKGHYVAGKRDHTGRIIKNISVDEMIKQCSDVECYRLIQI